MKPQRICLANWRSAWLNKVPAEENEVDILVITNASRCREKSGVRLGGGGGGGGGGRLLSGMLIKVGRCIKMLQISSASLVISKYFAGCKYICSADLSAHICWAPQFHSATMSSEGGSLQQITIEAGAAEIKRFYFCCNWEKGAPSVSLLGLLLQILISIFPLFSLTAL